MTLVSLLRAAAGDPEPGDHLVEDQERAVLVAEQSEPFEVPVVGRHDAHVRGDRLDDERRDGSFVRIEERGDLVEIVEGRDHGVARGAGGDAGRARDREGREPAPGAVREQRVGVSVVAALELDQGVLARRGPRQRIADIAASVPEETSLTCSTEGTIETIRSASSTSPSVGTPKEVPREAASIAASDDLLAGMPEEQSAPRLAEVDVACSVGVLEIGTFAPDGEPRDAADRAERADGRVHAAGDRSLRSLEEFLGTAHRPVSLWVRSACGWMRP